MASIYTGLLIAVADVTPRQAAYWTKIGVVGSGKPAAASKFAYNMDHLVEAWVARAMREVGVSIQELNGGLMDRFRGLRQRLRGTPYVQTALMVQKRRAYTMPRQIALVTLPAVWEPAWETYFACIQLRDAVTVIGSQLPAVAETVLLIGDN